MSVVLGIDTGGTFTDFVLVDEDRGAITTAKVPSTPGDPAAAIAAGLARLEGVERVERLIIGTTVATNAVLERRGPAVVYITNRGFEDVPFIARADKERIYDLHWQKPRPLVRRRHCFGIGGRFDTHGREIIPLEADDLEALKLRAAELAGEDVAVAICCLFAYLDGSHERRAADAVREALPQAHISLSHEVSPLWREYERASTTIADAFIKPVVSRYVQGVGRVIEEKLATKRWNLLASNGGYLRADQAERRPAQLLISGLAGGVIGGRYYAELAKTPRAFTLDIGGTSTDIGLILEGGQQYASEFQIDFGIPVTIPCVAVRTIGAGGGSIAWIDKGGLLHVGPQSAGAEPGPVAYGRGGQAPTVTDANLVLGRLDPAFFLGGAMPLDLAAARAALARLGEALSLSAEDAALAVIRTVDENMANAIRLIAVERGLDTRDFALIAFGGAGPLHARSVAERLSMTSVIVPPHPGLCSAFGAAIAEARVDRVQTLFTQSDNVDVAGLAEALKRLRLGAVEELRRSVDVAAPEVRSSADMRYAGQNYELEVQLPEGEMDAAGWQALMDRFAEAHAKQYGFALPGEPVELINLRVTALRPEPARDFIDLSRGGGRAATARPVWFDSGKIADCPIVHRASLQPGETLTGPAVIEETDSTTVLHPGDQLTLGPAGLLALSLGEDRMSPRKIEADAVGLNVLHNALANIAAEMAIVMMKTSYSTIFNEGLDFSTMLLDREGNLIAEKNFAPSMMGAVNYALRWTLEELGEFFFQPGDIVVHNDPYRGNCHLPEHMLMKPIFRGTELIGFAGCIGHMAEIGGKAPGSFASDATDVYQEGLRLPPVKLFEGGKYNEQLWRVILANHRTPRNSWGDLHAMVGALNIGERRLLELGERYDFDSVIEGARRLIDYSERRLSAEIAEIPEGTYSAEMMVEDDGVGTDPFEVKVKLIVRGGQVIADFTGSSPQVRGPMNCTFVVVAAALYNAIFCVADPQGLIPRNAGCYRPARIIAPPGTVVNVKHPGPSVGGNTDLQPKLIDLLLAAFSKVVPERVAAATGGSSSNLLFGGVHPETGRYYSNYHFDGLGAGGTALKDGNDGEVTRHSNCRNTPVEVFEHRYPLLTLNYGLAQDSGGAGKHRGGLSTQRSFRITAPEITFSALFDRCKLAPPPLFDGLPGGRAALLVKRRGESEFQSFDKAFGVASPSKFTNVVLHEGDELYYCCPGGAGFGDPAERDPALLAEDVAEGYVSPAAALRDYGVSLDERGEPA